VGSAAEPRFPQKSFGFYLILNSKDLRTLCEEPRDLSLTAQPCARRARKVGILDFLHCKKSPKARSWNLRKRVRKFVDRFVIHKFSNCVSPVSFAVLVPEVQQRSTVFE
jgi:hypothetical protein